MGFFSWQEIKQMSKRLATDTFVNSRQIDSEGEQVIPQSEEQSYEKQKAEDEEPDLEKFEIRMRKPDELEREIRDDLKRQSKDKKVGNYKKAGG